MPHGDNESYSFVKLYSHYVSQDVSAIASGTMEKCISIVFNIVKSIKLNFISENVHFTQPSLLKCISVILRSLCQ